VPDIQSQEEFEHYHSGGIKNIRLDEGELVQARQKTNLGPFDDALQQSATRIRETLSAAPSNAEQVFKLAMGSLKEADLNRFVIENVLEALKRGEPCPTVLKRFSELGLPVPQNQAAQTPLQPITPFQATMALLERKSIWERLTTSVAQIAVNAIKTVPKWVEIEPEIGFVGCFPKLSFHLKAKGMTAYEFFEALRGTGTRYGGQL